MAALLVGINEGDEVIMPSYTFPSTANAFVLHGARVVFIDIRPDTMNIDESLIEEAVTDRTRADSLLISDPGESARNSWREALALDASAAEGKIRVTGFSANELRLEATVANESGLWLYYADAWHPGWKAFVNGKQEPIYKADIAFKTVKIGKGKNIVRFYFDNEPSRTVGRILILFEILSAMVLLAAASLRAIYPT